MMKTVAYILCLLLILLLAIIGGCEESRLHPWTGLHPGWHSCRRSTVRAGN